MKKLKSEEYKDFKIEFIKERIIGANIYIIHATNMKAGKTFSVKTVTQKKTEALEKLKRMIDKFTDKFKNEKYKIEASKCAMSANVKFHEGLKLYYVPIREQRLIEKRYEQLVKKLKKINPKIRVTTYNWANDVDGSDIEDNYITFNVFTSGYDLTKDELKKVYEVLDEYTYMTSLSIISKFSGEHDIKEIINK